jgi:hypothetical protein
MKRTIALFSMLLLFAASSNAEIQSIDLTIFGMD